MIFPPLAHIKPGQAVFFYTFVFYKKQKIRL